MPDVSGQGEAQVADSRAARQRDAVWKWRWLGLRDSTPAFKASLVLLAAMLLALVTYAAVIGH
jgi:hypothetical protein